MDTRTKTTYFDHRGTLGNCEAENVARGIDYLVNKDLRRLCFETDRNASYFNYSDAPYLDFFLPCYQIELLNSKLAENDPIKLAFLANEGFEEFKAAYAAFKLKSHSVIITPLHFLRTKVFKQSQVKYSPEYVTNIDLLRHNYKRSGMIAFINDVMTLSKHQFFTPAHADAMACYQRGLLESPKKDFADAECAARIIGLLLTTMPENILQKKALVEFFLACSLNEIVTAYQDKYFFTYASLNIRNSMDFNRRMDYLKSHRKDNKRLQFRAKLFGFANHPLSKQEIIDKIRDSQVSTEGQHFQEKSPLEQDKFLAQLQWAVELTVLGFLHKIDWLLHAHITILEALQLTSLAQLHLFAADYPIYVVDAIYLLLDQPQRLQHMITTCVEGSAFVIGTLGRMAPECKPRIIEQLLNNKQLFLSFTADVHWMFTVGEVYADYKAELINKLLTDMDIFKQSMQANFHLVLLATYFPFAVNAAVELIMQDKQLFKQIFSNYNDCIGIIKSDALSLRVMEEIVQDQKHFKQYVTSMAQLAETLNQFPSLQSKIMKLILCNEDYYLHLLCTRSNTPAEIALVTELKAHKRQAARQLSSLFQSAEDSADIKAMEIQDSAFFKTNKNHR